MVKDLELVGFRYVSGCGYLVDNDYMNSDY